MIQKARHMQELFRHFYHHIMLGANTIGLLLGFVYLFVNRNNELWNMYGFLMLIVYLLNIRTARKEQLKITLAYGYLVLSFLGMLLVMCCNTVASLLPKHQSSQSFLSYVILLMLFLIGGILSAQHIGVMPQNEIKSNEVIEPEKKRSMAKFFIVIVLSVILVYGLYIIFTLLKERRGGIVEAFIPQYALFYAISFLSLGILIDKIIDAKKHFYYSIFVVTISLLIFIVCMLPFFSTLSLLHTSKQNFMDAFGDIYHEKNYKGNLNFRQAPFLLTEYFFGSRSGNYHVEENILFHEGRDKDGRRIGLYFDVYTPLNEGSSLPGKRSVLIRIHGGGWTSGDKGIYNFSQMNKYFAAQGFVVFDIQYGLRNTVTLSDIMPADITRRGNFDIDDMVEHIGIFLKYLADHREQYQVNLNSVFLSGGSAGGHLALTTGLGLASGNYTNLLDDRIKVKGLVPFYPGNGLSRILGIDGKDEFVDPYGLVDENSPPCLLYQGTHDGLVDAAISERFGSAYLQKNNPRCAVILMPFGSHASDLYFAGYYNQVFLYYMERFLSMYQ